MDRGGAGKVCVIVEGEHCETGLLCSLTGADYTNLRVIRLHSVKYTHRRASKTEEI